MVKDAFLSEFFHQILGCYMHMVVKHTLAVRRTHRRRKGGGGLGG